MKIKKGDKFLCIKDAPMLFADGVVYNKGNVYTSEEDGCITNNKGYTSHRWDGVARSLPYRSLLDYFKPLKDVDRMYTKATDRLRELHRNFTGWKIGDPDEACHFDNKGINHDDFAFSAKRGLEEDYEERGYDYVSEEVFIELNGLEEKPYDEDTYNWVNNDMKKSVISNKKDEIVQNVIQKYEQRSQVGIKKYNTTLQENSDGIEVFLNHLQEELMDATLYIEKLKHQFAKLKKEL